MSACRSGEALNFLDNNYLWYVPYRPHGHMCVLYSLCLALTHYGKAALTCSRRACANAAPSDGTERKELQYVHIHSHKHTHRFFSHRQMLCSNHRLPDWLSSLQRTHARIPARRACLRVIGRNRNTWHSDTVLDLVPQAEKEASVCGSIKQNRLEFVLISCLPSGAPTSFIKNNDWLCQLCSHATFASTLWSNPLSPSAVLSYF